MDAAELQKLRMSFLKLINNVEMEHSYYFCLHSVQKGLDRIESIYDHIKLDQETMEFHFKLDSDLPAALRELICNAHQQVFSGENLKC